MSTESTERPPADPTPPGGNPDTGNGQPRPEATLSEMEWTVQQLVQRALENHPHLANPFPAAAAVVSGEQVTL